MGRSELQLLSVSSDGTLTVFIKRLIVTDSFFSSTSSLHSSLSSTATFVAPPQLSCFRGFEFRQPLRLYSPMQIPLLHLWHAKQTFSYCISLNGSMIFFVALHEDTRLNAQKAFLFFLRGKKCKLCKIIEK